MTTETESAPAAVCGGDACSRRSTEQDDRLDYCEGCELISRRCPACEQWRPQTGWWWGTVAGRIDRWVCSACRVPLDPDDIRPGMKPVLRSHPDFRRQRLARSFTLTVDLPDERRFRLVGLLDRVAGRCEDQPTEDVAAAMVAAASSGAGRHEIDTSRVTLEGARELQSALYRAAYANDAPMGAPQLIQPVLSSWVRWLERQTERPSDGPSDEDKAAAERARRRAGYERKADHG